MVKLGLYDPGFEEEIAFFTFDEIYSWGASDLEVRSHFPVVSLCALFIGSSLTSEAPLVHFSLVRR